MGRFFEVPFLQFYAKYLRKNFATTKVDNGGFVGYKCNCPAGFLGLHCATTPCSHEPCQNRATCNINHGFGTYLCSCVIGFSGDECQVTPCTVNPCQYGGTCEIVNNGQEGAGFEIPGSHCLNWPITIQSRVSH